MDSQPDTEGRVPESAIAPAQLEGPHRVEAATRTEDPTRAEGSPPTVASSRPGDSSRAEGSVQAEGSPASEGKRPPETRDSKPTAEAGVEPSDPEAAASAAVHVSTQSGADRATEGGPDDTSAEPTTSVEPRRGPARVWMRRIAFGLLLSLGIIVLVGTIYTLVTWPDIDRLATQRPETTAFIERYSEGQRQAGLPAEPSWRWVPYSQISPHLKRAAVAAEDISFFSHGGFDFEEIEVAVRAALAGRDDLRGASTITQQLSKNLWLSPSRNPWRKVKEAVLTWQLEKKLSKHRILELYLNVVEFGRGVYGAEAAARHYFGKSAAELNESEAAQLAASLPRPSRWNPWSGSEAYWSYVADILRRLEKAEFLRRYIPADESDPADPTPEAADTLAAR